MKTIFSVSAVIAVAIAAPVAAQDVSADPTYETVSLSGGFANDPYTVPISSGGLTDASNLGGGCRGFIATRPDVRLYFEAGSLPLILSATSDADTTIVVNGPDGNWYCDDDSGGSLNPMLRFDPAMSGRYEIWVGTYGEAANYPATVNISEIYGPADNLASTTTQFVPSPTTSAGPDVNATPIYETVTLSAGYTPDPYIVSLASGGVNNASDVASGCRGYIASSPDVRLNYSAGSLPLILSVNSDADTTLVVNGPDGQWYCDDDGGAGLNPSLRFGSPMSGRYEIWVGTYGSTDTADADLHISELYSQ